MTVSSEQHTRSLDTRLRGYDKSVERTEVLI